MLLKAAELCEARQKVKPFGGFWLRLLLLYHVSQWLTQSSSIFAAMHQRSRDKLTVSAWLFVKKMSPFDRH